MNALEANFRESEGGLKVPENLLYSWSNHSDCNIFLVVLFAQVATLRLTFKISLATPSVMEVYSSLSVELTAIQANTGWPGWEEYF